MTTVDLGQYDAATRMRDIIRSVVTEEMDKQRPVWKYGSVQTINRTQLVATVLLNGDTVPVRCQMAASVQPLSSAALIVAPDVQPAVVRVEGKAADLWITEVVYGASYGTFGTVQTNNFSSPDAITESGGIAATGNITATGSVTATDDLVAGDDLTVGDKTTSRILRLTSTTDASTSSTDHAFQVGPDASANIIMDDNEIMARINGAASTLHFNADGGLVTFGLGQGIGDRAQFGVTSQVYLIMRNNEVLARLPAGTPADLYLSYLGTISNGNVRIGEGGSAGIICPTMRAVSSLDAAGAATTSTGFAALGATSLAFVVPPSGTVLIDISCRMSLTGTAAAGNRGLVTFVLTGAGGHSFNDNEAIEIPQPVAGVSTVASCGRSTLVAGLTAGATCTLTINGRVTNALMTNTVTNIRASVTPSP